MTNVDDGQQPRDGDDLAAQTHGVAPEAAARGADAPEGGGDGQAPDAAPATTAVPAAPAAEPRPHPPHGHMNPVIDDGIIARAFKPTGAVADDLVEDAKLGTVNQNPDGISFWRLVREDLLTHDNDVLSQGFWALSVHRFGNWRMGIRNRFVRLPFSLLYKFLYKCVEWTCGISLNYPVKVGRRVRIWHHGGMILGARSIGNDVHIRQNTTFGVARRGDARMKKPIIEDRVDIGAGAVITGAIRIGHDSVIGANAVVLKDVPPYSVAVGVPAKVVKTIPPPPPPAVGQPGTAATTTATTSAPAAGEAPLPTTPGGWAPPLKAPTIIMPPPLERGDDDEAHDSDARTGPAVRGKARHVDD